MFSDLYSIVTILIILTALFGYINFRFIKLPPTIGIMLISLACSLAFVFIGKFDPGFLHQPKSLISSIDFESLLMRVLLSFLLFAGAIHIDVRKLKRELRPIIAFATVGVLISTAVIGVVMYLVFGLLHLSVPFIYCLLFGALISPTDPIAVLGILKEAKIPSSLEIKITGESLFNDGVGVVVFATILEVAEVGLEHMSFLQIGGAFIKEAGGGIVWGIILGYAGFYLLRSIDHYQVEVLITLAMVMGGYLLASYFHISGPLAMVVAGIITGNKGEEAMSDVTKDYIDKFWELLDEILNAILFLLIGFEIMILAFPQKVFLTGVIAIVVVLLARFISVYIPSLLLRKNRSFEQSMLPVLTWGGLRGGISVALALSVPAGMHRSEFVSITYIVVIFSIIVQGLTIGKLAKRLASKSSANAAA